MPGSRPQDRKDGKVAFRVRSREHIEIVSEIVMVPVGVPTDITVRLMIEAVAFTVTYPVFQTITGAGLPFPCSGINRGTITGDGPSLTDLSRNWDLKISKSRFAGAKS